MVMLKPVRLWGKRLQLVPELGPYEINVGALTENHVGLTIAVRRRQNTLTGPLQNMPTASVTKPLLVLQVGDFPVAMHPRDAVMVVPKNHKVTIVIGPKAEAANG